MSGILIVAEQLRGMVRDVTREAIGAAVALQPHLGGEVVVLVAGDDPQALAAGLDLAGVDRILTVRTAPHPDPFVVEDVAARVAEQLQSRLIMLGQTADGMAVAPALAARLGAGFASDVVALAADAGGGLLVSRGGHGNKVCLELELAAEAPAVVMLRGATFKAPTAPGSAVVEPMELAAPAPQWAHERYIEPESAGVDIAKAGFILSIGRGIQAQDNVPRLAALAERLGAALGCSRPIADSGWLHKAHQVGLTGKVATGCKLYLALGISGAVQHLHGMKHVETIVAINTDANAPIFNVATYGACIDVFAFADALERQFN